MKIQQRYFLGKEDKLKSRKVIQQLFEEGKQITVFPLKAIWMTGAPPSSLQAAVSVSARHFKKAVDRNRIKRLIRESYRLQKNELSSHLIQKDKQLSVFFIFIGNELPHYQLVSDACGKLLKKLILLTNENNQ